MQSKTVLVVDDDGDSRLICSTILLHHGFRIVEAGDGLEAVQTAQAERPDVILMDLALPSLDGWSALERLRSDPHTADIPVIVLTAHATAEALAQGRRAGVDGYLTKPCSPSRVLDEVRRVVDVPLPDAG